MTRGYGKRKYDAKEVLMKIQIKVRRWRKLNKVV
jgi:hypothetical protein